MALAGHDEELTVAAAGSAGPDGGTVEPDSAFRVGSMSKTFVAVMLLQLVDDGTIGLDDLVVDHAPDLTIADGVTIRQLLAHRSGLPEYNDGELAPAVLADPARTWTPADVLDLVADQPRDFAPDTQFAYSNTNYIVAGLLLEAVTGMTLAENLQSRIVEPLGLTSHLLRPRRHTLTDRRVLELAARRRHQRRLLPCARDRRRRRRFAGFDRLRPRHLHPRPRPRRASRRTPPTRR